MTTRDAFTVEEWANVATLDEAVGAMLSDAEMGGSGRENRELLKVMREAAGQFPNDELIASIAAGTYDDRATELEQPWRAGGDQSSNSGAAVLARVTKAVALVAQKATPAETENYKRYIYYIGEQVASANKEGGFLGIGGERISPMEHLQLVELQAALGLAA